MRRTLLLPAAVAAAAVALAGCTGHPATDSSPAAPRGSAAGAPSGAGTPSEPRTPAGPASGAASTLSAAKGEPLRAPSSYVRSRENIPQQPSGYATVEVPVPVGWTAHSSGSGVGWWSRVGQDDRRDPSGRLLVRVRNEPATGETEDGSLLAVIAGYRTLPGATVAVSHAPHQARTGLREADWTIAVPVGGRPRTAQVSAWVLNGQVITVYASGPADSGAVVRVLHDHAADLRIWTHIGPEAG
jgi:hypothetical protein